MEQNPNEETVDVNASPQQPEAKDTLETTDDMDSQASVKTEGSTEADTVASQDKEAIKEAIPEDTALEAEPAQDTEKADAEADTEAGATENTAEEEKTETADTLREESVATAVSDAAAAKTEAGAEGTPSAYDTEEITAADTPISEKATPAEGTSEGSLEDAVSEAEASAEQTVQEPALAEAVDSDSRNEEAIPAEDTSEERPEDTALEAETSAEQAEQEPVSLEAVETDNRNEDAPVSEEAVVAGSANRKKKPKKDKGKLSRGRKIVNGIIIAFLTVTLLGSGTGAYLLYHIASGMMASPTEMAAAYATLANGGTYNEAHLVRKIVYKNEDKTIKAKVQTHQPLSPQAAYMTSDLLYRAIFGKDSGMNLMSQLGFGAYPVYGKTGTSDWADDAWKYGGPMKDEWMINYTSEYTIATWSGFDSGIEGKPTYISEDILNANIPGWINKYMLDSIATGNEHMISSPGGISSYGGGMIKSEWLASAKQNNPLTIANSKTNNKALKSAVSSAKGMKSSDYTAETYSKLQAAIAAAEKILKDDMAPQEDIDKAKADLQAAMNALVSSANKSNLNAALTKAAGINTSLYTPESINALNAAVNSAKSVYDNKKSTQAQIDAQTSAVNNAINTLVQKPVISRDALNEAINKGNAINRNSYTVESILSFESILNTAKTVYGDANATQAQIDEQTAKVNAALTEVLKPAQ